MKPRWPARRNSAALPANRRQQSLERDALVTLLLVLDPVLKATSSIGKKPRDLEEGFVRLSNEAHMSAKGELVPCSRDEWPRIFQPG